MQLEPVEDFVSYYVNRPDPGLVSLLEPLNDIAFVAGSAARSAILGNDEEPGDIDLWLRDGSDSTLAEACRRLVALGYEETLRLRAVTFQRKSVTGKSLPVQIVIPFKDDYTLTYGEVRDVLKQFAFTAQQFAVELKDGKLYGTYSRRGVEDARARRLEIAFIGSPIFTIWSGLKYTEKGYTLGVPALKQLFEAWDTRSPEWKSDEFKRVTDHPHYRTR